MKENQLDNEFHVIGKNIRGDIENLNRDSSTFEIAALTGLLCVTEVLGQAEASANRLGTIAEQTGALAASKASGIINLARNNFRKTA